MTNTPIVSAEAWNRAREELLIKEKELTRLSDELAAQRRRMPRTRVDSDYRFDGPDGPVSLLDLFEGRSQLIVYRFFFEPGVQGWPDSGCTGCSLMADQVGHLSHLNARDITYARVSPTGLKSTGPISLTCAATKRSAARGAIWTSHPWAAKRIGKTRPMAIRRHRPISGGSDTTNTPARFLAWAHWQD